MLKANKRPSTELKFDIFLKNTRIFFIFFYPNILRDSLRTGNENFKNRKEDSLVQILFTRLVVELGIRPTVIPHHAIK